MFCSNCGEAVTEGAAFCKNCGAPVATPPETPPPPPPVQSSTAAPSPPPAAAQWQQQAQWQSAPPPAPKGRRVGTGLIVGIVVAVILILAGAGTAAYLLTRDGASATRDGEVVVSTTSPATTSTSISETTSTVTESSTTTTVPSSAMPTIAPTRSTLLPTLPTGQDLGDPYLTATDAVAEMLLFYDERIPQLAQAINASAPDVPQGVYEELNSMMLSLEEVYDGLGEIPLPAGFEESDYWLDEAILFMDDRLFATLEGIEAMWDSGSAAAGDSFFEKGRQARDDFHAAWEKYHEVLPIE